MQRSFIPMIDFSYGEINPIVDGRTDLPLFYKSARIVKNFIPMVQGPAFFRGGTTYIAEAMQDPTNAPMLLPFIFNDSISYMLEFSTQKIRVFNDNGLIVATPLNATSVTVTNIKAQHYNFTFTVGSHTTNVGQSVFIAGMTPPRTHVNGYATVTAVTGTTISVTIIGSTSPGTFALSGVTLTPEVTIATPYLGDEFRDVRVAAINDVMYLVHPKYAPRKLTRSSHTSWSFTTPTLTGTPFDVGNYPGAVCFHEQRLWFGGTESNPQKLWGSVPGSYENFTTGTNATDAVAFVLNSRRYFTIRWLESTEEYLLAGGSDMNYKVYAPDGGAITPTNVKSKRVDSFGSARIPPAVIDNALVFVRKDLRKLRAIQYNFDAQAYASTDLTKAAENVTFGDLSQITFQEGSTNTLWAQKLNGELIGLNYDTEEGIIGWHRHSTRPGDKIVSVAAKPVDGDNDQLWLIVQRTVDSIPKYYIERMVQNPEFLARKEFYTGDKAADKLAYKTYLWEQHKQCVHLDSSLTYDGSIQTRNLTFGALTGNAVTVTASGSVFTAGMVGRQIWEKGGPGRAEIVGYTSATVVTVEISRPFSHLTFTAGNWYLTSNQLSGLAHLEGVTVAIVADGANHNDAVVSGNSVHLDFQASVIHVGLEYEGILASNDMGSRGATKSCNKAKVNLSNSIGTLIGSNIYNMERIPFRSIDDGFGAPPALFSGTKEVVFSDTSDEEKIIYIKQSKQPCLVKWLRAELGEGA